METGTSASTTHRSRSSGQAAGIGQLARDMLEEIIGETVMEEEE
jgi:hypothetical protein